MLGTTAPPYQLSPRAWGLGYRDHRLAIELHDMGCDEPGYEERQQEVAELFDNLDAMTAPELRAYIAGIHESMSEYFT